ncbi:MAG TPA: c-type cytochrome [Solirubrobacteraceae bacterium]
MSSLLQSALRVGGPLSRRRQWALAVVAFACAVLALGYFDARAQSAAPLGRTAAVGHASASQVAVGHALFLESCASCHGLKAQGIAGRAPSLHGVGALAADFYLETGRMPLATPRQEPVRTRPAFPQAEISALIAYVASFGGPGIPRVDPGGGSLSGGQQLFALDCAGCHTIQARGGVVTGALVPALTPATSREIGEAIRIGPYAMPPFGPGQLSNAQIDAIARYVQSTNHPDDRGGWDIGRIGPITEGMAAWLLAVVALLIIARLLGERSPSQSRRPR